MLPSCSSVNGVVKQYSCAGSYALVDLVVLLSISPGEINRGESYFIKMVLAFTV